VIPRRLGRFEIVREIGRGAMGQVLLAHDPRIGRDVALKTLVPAGGVSEEEARETSSRFLREAQAAGRLLHPNIVTIFDVGEDQGLSFIAMEYIDGGTLEPHARPKALLPPGRVLDLMAQAAAALDYAHDAGVVHRDIKPANLMLQKDGTLKVTDFGLAKQRSANLTLTGVLLGTPSYMSPEQIQGKELDGRSDLFSLGVVLYELLTGVRPFDADSISTIIYRVLYEDPRPAAAHNPSLPDGLHRVLDRALAKNTASRYASGALLVADLRQAFSGLSPQSLSQPFPRPTPASPTMKTARPQPEARAVAKPAAPASRAAAPQSSPKRPPRATPPASAEARTTFLAHHPLKIAALLIVLVAAVGLFPRVSNRAERSKRPAGSTPPAAGGTGKASAGASSEAFEGQAAGLAGAPHDAAPAQSVSMRVITRPPGGSIHLDDLPIAGGRVVLSLLDRSTHTIRARAGCLEAVEEVSAADVAAMPGTLELALTPRSTMVAIDSVPSGARLRLDGKETGKTTPVEISWDACRERAVGLDLEGHKPWSGTFAVGADAEAAAALAHVALAPIPRGRVVLPRPSGYSADVFAGSVRLGRAGEPLLLPEGRHTLVVRNDKLFVRETVQVAVEGDRATSPVVSFPGLGSLTVQAQPSNCKVFVDDAYVDVTPVLNLPIGAGDHKVKVVFVPTGAAQERDVAIRTGRNERVVVRF
jgi:serine/threonine protein kinase